MPINVANEPELNEQELHELETDNVEMQE